MHDQLLITSHDYKPRFFSDKISRILLSWNVVRILLLEKEREVEVVEEKEGGRSMEPDVRYVNVEGVRWVSEGEEEGLNGQRNGEPLAIVAPREELTIVSRLIPALATNVALVQRPIKRDRIVLRPRKNA